MAARIRLLHAYPVTESLIMENGGKVDIVLNEETIAESLEWSEATQWQEVEPGRGILSVYPAEDREQLLVSNHVIVPEEGNYTLVLAQREGTAVIATVKDGETAVPEGYSGVRFGHLVSGAQPVKVVLVDRFENEETIYEEVEYGQITEYILNEEEPIAFDLYMDSVEERCMRIPWKQYKEGRAYMIFLLGSIKDKNKIKIVALEEDQG